MVTRYYCLGYRDSCLLRAISLCTHLTAKSIQAGNFSSGQVRVLFNGKTLRLGGQCEGQYPLCAWDDWRKLLEGMIPTKSECPEFYAAWYPTS